MLRAKGAEIAGRKITVCGAGGAGTAIAVQCALDGARAVSIFNRRSGSWNRALETARKIKAVRPDCRVEVCDLEDQALLAEEIAGSDILANGTNLGMKPLEDRMVIADPSVLRPGLIVTDAVYDPVETRLLNLAKDAGCLTFGGKDMLLWQGVAAFKLFTGHDMPVEEVKARYFAD
jgi:shikimate dehydrogenase